MFKLIGHCYTNSKRQYGLSFSPIPFSTNIMIFLSLTFDFWASSMTPPGFTSFSSRPSLISSPIRLLPYPSNDVESRLFQTPISRYLFKASSSRQKFRSNSFIRTKSSRQSGIDGDPKSSHRSLLLFSLLLVESWCWVRSWCHYHLCDFSSHKAWIFLRNKLQDLVQLPSPQV